MTAEEIAAALFGGACVLACFVAARWADRRYARFERLPGLFGITGKVARLDPRRVTLFLYPALAATILAFGLVLVLASGLPTHGNLKGVFPAIGLGFMCSMAFHLWMIDRWAQRQS
tara:strand:- start:1539 stop:1886 length:348 start_codon:yes stop_codon:yes gene_type:complete